MADQKVKEMEPVETQIVEIMPPDIENLIYVVRNKQVMVDSDLAMLYQVETKALNQCSKKKYKTDFQKIFVFSLQQKNTRIFEVPIWHLKNDKSQNKKDGRWWQTYATVCIYRAGNIHAGQCIA